MFPAEVGGHGGGKLHALRVCVCPADFSFKYVLYNTYFYPPHTSLIFFTGGRMGTKRQAGTKKKCNAMQSKAKQTINK